MYSEFCCKVTAFLLNIPPQNVTNTLRGVSLTSLYVTNTLFWETSGLFCSEKARFSGVPAYNREAKSHKSS